MKFWKQHLTTKIAGSFLLLSLFTVGVVGGVTFIRAREALKKETFERLDVAASLKQQEISRWFQTQLKDFSFIRVLSKTCENQLQISNRMRFICNHVQQERTLQIPASARHH